MMGGSLGRRWGWASPGKGPRERKLWGEVSILVSPAAGGQPQAMALVRNARMEPLALGGVLL